jgi:hypothetical protein
VEIHNGVWVGEMMNQQQIIIFKKAIKTKCRIISLHTRKPHMMVTMDRYHRKMSDTQELLLRKINLNFNSRIKAVSLEVVVVLKYHNTTSNSKEEISNSMEI